MGFWNPRTICPSCGAKIHSQALGWSTGKQCPQCGVPLTGRVGLGGTARIDEGAFAERLRASEADATAKRFETLDRLVRLRDAGELTEGEFAHEKGKLLGSAGVSGIPVALDMGETENPVSLVVRRIPNDKVGAATQVLRAELGLKRLAAAWVVSELCTKSPTLIAGLTQEQADALYRTLRDRAQATIEVV